MKTYIKKLDSKRDSKILFDIVKYEDEIFGDGSVGKWNIKPFAKYGKVFAQFAQETDEIISVIEVLSSFDRKKAYLYGVFTVEKYCSKGYGKKILQYVLEDLKKENIKEVELTVSPENEIAIKLYEKFGFKIKEKLENEYGEGNNRYLMTFDLK